MKILSLAGLDPRVKIIMMLCFSTLALATGDLTVLCLIAATALLILLGGGTEPLLILRRIRGVAGIILSLFLIQCIFIRTGAPLLVIGSLPLITADGFQMAAMLGLRLFILVFSALMMLSGTPRDYLLALAQWKIPYEIVFMVMAAIYFLPILRTEALNVFYAVQLRGTELRKTTLRRKLAIYLKICLPILVLALNHVKAMSMSMEAKAFRAYPQRTYMRRLVLTKRDRVGLAFWPLLTVCLLILLV